MDNPDKLETLDKQDTRRGQTKQNTTQQTKTVSKMDPKYCIPGNNRGGFIFAVSFLPQNKAFSP